MPSRGRPKRGTHRIVSVWIECPHCCTGLTDRGTGSFLIQAPSGYTADQVVACAGCGERYRVPAIVAALA